jgi:hypothetical protein
MIGIPKQLHIAILSLALLPLISHSKIDQPIIFLRELNISYLEAKTALESPSISKLTLGKSAGQAKGSVCRFTRKQSEGVNIVFEITCLLPFNVAEGYSIVYRIELLKIQEFNYKTHYLATISTSTGRNVRGEIELMLLMHGKSSIEIKVMESTYSSVLIQIVKTFLQAAQIVSPDKHNN